MTKEEEVLAAAYALRNGSSNVSRLLEAVGELPPNPEEDQEVRRLASLMAARDKMGEALDAAKFLREALSQRGFDDSEASGFALHWLHHCLES